MLVATHDPAVEAAGDRVVHLQGGTVLAPADVRPG